MLRRCLVLVAMMLLAMALGVAPAWAARASEGAISVSVPQDGRIVPNDCNGELVEVSGDLHFVFNVVLNPRGGITVVSSDNPQGITGVGLTTGTQYQGTGGARNIIAIGSPTTSALSFTIISNFRLVSEGSSDNFLVHETIHFTLTPDGEVTAEVVKLEATCKG
jgi:hypothetical protein